MDSGYQGIAEIHKNSETPKKKPKGGELTQEEKSENKRISRERILIENVNAKIKVFKIMANKYRIENTLVKDSQFKLPGKKALLEDDSIEVILVDVTECPIERPKKNSGNTTPAKRKSTP